MDIIRAWKDAEYRNSLSEAERAALPPNPAGIVELSDDDMHIARRLSEKDSARPVGYRCGG
jgi:mersacidin/lichenicidin family type 2 lantibiotic